MKDKLFQTICCLVLLNRYSSYTEINPNMLEKLPIILNGNAEEAITFLNPINQEKVFKYCKEWNIEIPEIVKEYS